MKIKKLEISGFKSFFEKSSIAFPPGISAVVSGAEAEATGAEAGAGVTAGTGVTAGAGVAAGASAGAACVDAWTGVGA